MTTLRSRRSWRLGAVAVAASVLFSSISAPASAHPGHPHTGGSTTPDDQRSAVKLEQRHPDWWKSTDFTVLGRGDTAGYHISIAWEKEHFSPRPLATIQPGGYEEDDWLGYQCVTGDMRFVIANVMPKRAVNRQTARDRGGLLYAVRIADGKVTPLVAGLAFKAHAMNCGPGSTAAAVRHLGVDQQASELVLINAAKGTARSIGTVEGQLTWPVPAAENGIHAIRGGKVVQKSAGAPASEVGVPAGTPIKLAASNSGTDLLVADNSTHAVHGVTAYSLRKGRLSAVGTGESSEVQLLYSAAGTNVLLGLKSLQGSGVVRGARPTVIHSQGKIRYIDKVSADVVSAQGRVLFADGGRIARAIDRRTNKRTDSADSQFELNAFATEDGAMMSGAVTIPAEDVRTQTSVPTPLGATNVQSNGTSPVCGVARNDPRRQAYGPDHKQVQWAVEMASKEQLTGANGRPANYLQSGLAAYSPSYDFELATIMPSGGRVPPVVMNAILAQENNYRHASRRSLPGSGGNSAISDYYGSGGTLDAIDYDQADCGYGIAQVTTGMRLDDPSISANGKAKVAMDYAENIQAGMSILVDKWNQLYAAGIRANNSDPSLVENWYFAIWAYNTGVQPGSPAFGNTTGCTPSPSCTDPNGLWGLGWANNPMNPDYPADRNGFLRDTYADAAHPSDWPYQERVMGWAETPIFTYDGDRGYPAAVNGPAGPGVFPITLPARTTFCGPTNSCDTTSGCQRSDFRCWWHEPSTFVDACSDVCARSTWIYGDNAGEPTAANPWVPACNSDLGPNAVIVDDLTNPAYNIFCPSRNWSTQGSFAYTVGSDTSGAPVGIIDFHQLAAGLGAHTWFAGNAVASDTAHRVTGTWTPNTLATGAYVIKAHIPTAGASAGSASYKITLADGSVRTKVINQHEHFNHWKSLGVYQLGSNAKVELTNVTRDDTSSGVSTVAFDAVAFVPAPGLYVEQRLDAVAYFDEDVALATNIPTSWMVGIFGSAQAAYDWALGVSSFVESTPACTGAANTECVMPKTRQVLQAWRANVQSAGVDPVGHPDGSSVMQWMGLSNDISHRPTTEAMPSWFDNGDDSTYKIKSSATISYVKDTNGNIIPGSADVVYDDRTADTHLPGFIMSLFKAVAEDYGIEEPLLSYTSVNSNEYDHQVTEVFPNLDGPDYGVLPGRAFKHGGRAPVVTDFDSNPVETSGKCVAAAYISGGIIGYRPMLAKRYVSDSVEAWWAALKYRTDVPAAVSEVAEDIFTNWFMQGSPFNQATPIWQQLNFKACVDGSVRQLGNIPVLDASYMPNQYLYLNGHAIGLDGAPRNTASPVIMGDFAKFSNIPDPDDQGALWPTQYGDCGPNAAQDGNPWNMEMMDPVDFNPNTVHFCFDRNLAMTPEYS